MMIAYHLRKEVKGIGWLFFSGECRFYSRNLYLYCPKSQRPNYS
jgi:hypothetical protein